MGSSFTCTARFYVMVQGHTCIGLLQQTAAAARAAAAAAAVANQQTQHTRSRLDSQTDRRLTFNATFCIALAHLYGRTGSV